MSLFSGLSAFPITPLTPEGALDDSALGDLLERLVAAGVESVGLLGSTGAYPYLEADLRKRILRASVETLDGRVPLIVGVGAMCTDVAVDLARDAGRSGADGLLMAPVSYVPLREEEVFAHFRAVTAAVDLPICVYDNPGATHFSFSRALMGRLCRLPHAQAVKVPVPTDGGATEHLTHLRDALPDGITVGYSGMGGIADGLLAGADGWASSLGGTLPGPALALTRAAMAGDAGRAGAIDAQLGPLFALMAEWGSIRVMHETVRLLGLADAPLPRPLMPLDHAAIDRLRIALEPLD